MLNWKWRALRHASIRGAPAQSDEWVLDVEAEAISIVLQKKNAAFKRVKRVIRMTKLNKGLAPVFGPLPDTTWRLFGSIPFE